MVVLAWFHYHEIYPFINRRATNLIVKDPYGISYEVGMKSYSLRLFKKSPKCVYCNLVGSIFQLIMDGRNPVILICMLLILMETWFL